MALDFCTTGRSISDVRVVGTSLYRWTILFIVRGFTKLIPLMAPYRPILQETLCRSCNESLDEAKSPIHAGTVYDRALWCGPLSHRYYCAAEIACPKMDETLIYLTKSILLMRGRNLLKGFPK